MERKHALQILLTLGITGVIGYFGLLIGSLAACIRSLRSKSAALLGAAACSAYLLQGIVNNPTVTVTPVLFVCIGLLQAELRKGISGGSS